MTRQSKGTHGSVGRVRCGCWKCAGQRELTAAQWETRLSPELAFVRAELARLPPVQPDLVVPPPTRPSSQHADAAELARVVEEAEQTPGAVAIEEEPARRREDRPRPGGTSTGAPPDPFGFRPAPAGPEIPGLPFRAPPSDPEIPGLELRTLLPPRPPPIPAGGFVLGEAPQPDPQLTECFFYPGGARFRRFTLGVRKCVGGRLEQVKQAFGLAHAMVWAAKRELDHWASLPVARRMFLWGRGANAAPMDGVPPVTSAAFWFGNAFVGTPQDFEVRFSWVREAVRRWEKGFRKGFNVTNDWPVFILCSPNAGCLDTPARHIARNIVELCEGFFEDAGAPGGDRRAAVRMLHEMGHFSGGDHDEPPFDVRAGVCSGGHSGDACYRNVFQPADEHARFGAGNPRNLVTRWETTRSSHDMWLMLENIDNFTSYMWNRLVDRGTCILA